MSHTPKTPTPSYTTANLPSDLSEGSVVFNSTKQKSVIFKSGSWVDFGTENIGTPSYVRGNTGAIDQIGGDIPISWKSFDITLKGVVIGTSCETIYDGAFESCTGLVGNLVIPDSVSTIENLAFYNCIGLSDTLTIPNSVTIIDFQAFSNCTNITNVNCYVEKSVLDSSSCLLGSGVTTIHVRSTDTTWTAGSGQTIGGKSGITIIKDL